jgi:type II secretory pathway predicted ATPase ExeA
MYESFYRLTANPFRLTPDPKFCFSHPAYQEANAYLQYAFELGEGFILLTGRPGAGKTTLVESFLGSLESTEVVAARIAVTDFEASELLRAVAYKFNLDGQGVDKATLLRRIEHFFAARVKAGLRVLLVIDEAQRLSHASLEELRLLADLQLGASPLLQVFLVGQENLRKVMAEPEMEQLQQRVIGTCRLGPLGLMQTRSYVEHRLRRANWRGDPEITGAAVLSVFEYSKGVPRHINKICTRLLLQGFMDSKHVLDERDVYTVACELDEEQLAPMRIEAEPDGSAAPAMSAQTDMAPDLEALAIRAAPVPERAPPVVADRLPRTGSRERVQVASASDRSSPAINGNPAPVAMRPPAAYPGVRKPASVSVFRQARERLTTAEGWNLPAVTDLLVQRPALLFGLVAVLTLSAGTLTALLESHDDNHHVAGAVVLTDGQDADPGNASSGEPAGRVPVATRDDVTMRVASSGEIIAERPKTQVSEDASSIVSPAATKPVREALVQTEPQVVVPSLKKPVLTEPVSREPARIATSSRVGQSTSAVQSPLAPAEQPAAAHSLHTGTEPGETVAVLAPVTRASEVTNAGGGRVAGSPSSSARPAASAAVAAAGGVEVEFPAASLAAPTGVDERLSFLIERAEQALAEDRLLIPAGNSAHEYYQQVLSEDPGNVRAREGMRRIVARYTALAGSAINHGDNDRALRYIARGLRVHPGDVRLLGMQEHLKLATIPVVEPVPTPRELPPPALETPAKPGNFLQRLKDFFADGRSAPVSSDSSALNARQEQADEPSY